jgi:hypothetical protein
MADVRRMSRRMSTKISLMNRRNTLQVEQIVMGNPLDNLEVLHIEEKTGAAKDYSIRKALYKALNNLINLEREEDEEAEREANEIYENPALDAEIQKNEYNTAEQDLVASRKSDSLFFVANMNFLKKSKIYKDKLPFLKFRKMCMSVTKRISWLCHKIIKSPKFEMISLIVIILNSATLALQDPTSEIEDPTLSLFEFVFLILYTIEMGLKIFAMGFLFCKGAYLREGWNIMDFVIVSTAYLPYLLTSGEGGVNLSGLRALRVLRPLRTISTVKALKTLLTALFSALPLLLDTLFILLFFFLIFAISGLQLYSGNFGLKTFSLLPLFPNLG